MSIVKLTEAKPALKIQDDVLATGRRVLEAEAAALLKLALFLGDSFVQVVDMISVAEGRVIVTGVGKSGHVARKVAATLTSTGTPAFFIHPTEASHGDMGMIIRGDVVLAISNSGETREMYDIIEYTRRSAIPLVAVTSQPQSTLAQRADVALLLPVVAEACPNGLAPTTSTTLTMALGDALAITLLEKKGFTARDFRNYHPGGKLGQQLLCVSDIMHKGDQLPVAHESITMKEAVALMTEKGLGCVCLVDDAGVLAGLITDGDIRRHLSPELIDKMARDVMTRKPRTVPHNLLVAEAVAMMNDLKNTFRKITSLIVIDEAGKPQGLLHLHDCLRAGIA